MKNNEFDFGQTLNFSTINDNNDVVNGWDNNQALTKLKSWVANNIKWLENVDVNSGYKTKDDVVKLLAQYKQFLDAAVKIKAVNIMDKFIKTKISSKNGQEYSFPVYTIAVRYLDADGMDHVVIIKNLYDFVHFHDKSAPNDIFSGEELFGYDKLFNILSTFIHDTYTSKEAADLINNFKNAGSIIDDIPHFDQVKQELVYTKQKPQMAAYLNNASQTEAYLKNTPKVNTAIAQIIVKGLAENAVIDYQYGDTSHASLHRGPGLGNGDLILSVEGKQFGIEVKNITTLNLQSGLQSAFNRSHDQPYEVIFITSKLAFDVYNMTGEKPELIGTVPCNDEALLNKLINPDDLPTTYETIIDRINNKANMTDADKAVASFETLF